jgi:type III secretion protein O
MSIGQIEDFKAGLALLADRETRKEEDVAKARKEAEKARQTLEKARADAKTAQKNAAKIAAHKDIWSVEAKKEAERLEDLELEEFRPISRKGAEAEGEDC